MAKILIVEDESSIAELERDYLELAGYTVSIAGDGNLGKKKAIEEDYNLVILDLMLPECDGFEICQATKQRTLGIMSARYHLRIIRNMILISNGALSLPIYLKLR